MKRILLIAVIAIVSSLLFSACSGSSVKPNEASSADINNTSKSADTLEKYTCLMHPEVISDHPGECPKCGMTLVKQKLTAEQRKMLQDGNYVKPKD